jgi:hypothetical protein
MRGVWALLTLGVSLATPAAAEPAFAPFLVESSEGLHCGSPEAFAAELQQRSERVRAARPGEAAFALRIEVREHEGSLLGRLTLREPNGDVTVRAVPGATCEEVIDALLVIAAVLVQPSPAPERVEPAAPVRPPAAAGPWAVGASFGFVVQGAVAPEVRPGIGVEANLAYEGGSIASPLFALAYSRTLATSSARTPNGTAQLEWWTIRASLCPLRWPVTGRLALRPCGLFDLGQLAAKGVETELEASKSVLWIAPGASARLDALPVDWLVLTAEAGIFRPLNRDRFVFDPGLVVAFQPPPVGGLARLALGGRFQ